MAKVHPDCDLCGKAILSNNDGEFVTLNGVSKYVHKWHNRSTTENVIRANRNRSEERKRSDKNTVFDSD